MIKKLFFLLFLIIGSLVSFSVTIAALESSLQVTSTITPSTIAPGNDGYVQITITNVGTAYAERVEIKLISLDSPLIPKTQFVFYPSLGGLEVGKSITTTFKFSVPASATSGFYTAKFSLSACDGSVCKETIHYTIITVQAPSSLEITSVSPSSFKIGENATLNFTLANIGDISINNVIVSWKNPAILPLGSSDRIFIQSINARQTLQVPVQVVVKPDVTSGIYSFSITIEYTNQVGAKQTVNSTVGIAIKGEYAFIIVLDSQDIVAPGTQGSVNIKIINTGNQEAQFLVLRVLSSEPLIQITPSETYIGNLESDDYETERFTFKVSKTSSPGTYPLKLEINYKDLYGKFYVEEYSVNVEVSSVSELPKEPMFSPIITAGALIILIILAYFGYKKFVKIKK